MDGVAVLCRPVVRTSCVNALCECPVRMLGRGRGKGKLTLSFATGGGLSFATGLRVFDIMISQIDWFFVGTVGTAVGTVVFL